LSSIHANMSSDSNPIQNCIEVFLKEARQEDRLVKQLSYTMLSAYTNNPINLAINAPSGEGKNYVTNKVADSFPKQDVVFLAGMTDKALFHRSGILVIKNDVGEYEPIDDRIAKIDSEIEDKNYQIKRISNKNNDNDQKTLLKSQIKTLEDEKKDLLKNAKSGQIHHCPKWKARQQRKRSLEGIKTLKRAEATYIDTLGPAIAEILSVIQEVLRLVRKMDDSIEVSKR
jgi:hypothetical protein